MAAATRVALRKSPLRAHSNARSKRPPSSGKAGISLNTVLIEDTQASDNGSLAPCSRLWTYELADMRPGDRATSCRVAFQTRGGS
jgi:hypothetical protein